MPGSRPGRLLPRPDGKVWLPQTNGAAPVHGPRDARRRGLPLAADLRLRGHGGRARTAFVDDRLRQQPDRPLRAREPRARRPGPSSIRPSARLEPVADPVRRPGHLWISQLTGGPMDRFDPATGEITTYSGFAGPDSLRLLRRPRLRSEPPATNGRVVVLDPLLAAPTPTSRSTSETLTVGASPNKLTGLDSRLGRSRRPSLPPSRHDLAATDLTVDGRRRPGILRTQYVLTQRLRDHGRRRRESGSARTAGSAPRPSDDRRALGPDDPRRGRARGILRTRIRIDITLSNRGDAPDLRRHPLTCIPPAPSRPRRPSRSRRARRS